MRHLDLFAGIGGFSRAVEWLGGTTVAFVEWEAWNRRVLAKHWPNARYFGDIKTVTTDDLRGLGRIDLITGGYPCQPFSLAGQRRGAEDDRHLWPEMRRAIDVCRPTHVLAENVAGHITMGLDTVLADLEADGYACRAVVVPAGAVNALHRRDRVWIMAHAPRECSERSGAPWDGRAESPNRGSSLADTGSPRRAPADNEVRAGWNAVDAGSEPVGVVPDSDRAGRQERRLTLPDDAQQPSVERLCSGLPDAMHQRDGVQLAGVRTESARCGGRHAIHETARTLDASPDGISPGLVRRPAAGPTEPDLIRARWADGSWEAERPRVVATEEDRRPKLRGAGNAIVPLVAYELLRVMLLESEAA